MTDRINDQLSDLKAGQARQEAQTTAMSATLRDVADAIHKLLEDHEQRIRRLEIVVIAMALGGGSAAAKLLGFL